MSGWREPRASAPQPAVSNFRDRDRANTYVQIVEFPSYEEAMANSELPDTAEVATRLAELCDGPPTFRNLDVTRDMQM